jgi:pSer/pThr/pTyr-binding forkhead associated (FHA) protein
MWILRSVEDDGAAALTFRLLPGHEKTIGRSPRADFVVDAPLVSRIHCRATVSADGLIEIEDLDSTNGTWVNGRREARAVLKELDLVRVGRVTFVLERAI